jgi:hypothetical protein
MGHAHTADHEGTFRHNHLIDAVTGHGAPSSLNFIDCRRGSNVESKFAKICDGVSNHQLEALAPGSGHIRAFRSTGVEIAQANQSEIDLARNLCPR